ncbi:DUF4190 domain-containing protein [Salinibacterium sp.]|uniref:DUF4190 domain-containing protein n=1 Tax=Salinibacterium sp. TaxID=1915057 RepID=UPI002869F049|nr:DUF4190 domain-containing protein [Salinibacterium sp.]
MTEPTPYSAPQQPYAAGGAPAAPKWNTLAIISLVASVIGIHLAGIITGHIALNQIKKTGEQGNVLAIIGLIVGYIGIVVVVILTIVWIGILVAAGTNGYSSY